MTASKQELPARSRAAKQSAVTGIKANTVGMHQDSATTFSQKSGIDKEARRQMIAEAAYYRSQNRDYEAGCDIDDWLAAEDEIDQMLEF